jgi:hypothetical protein
MREASAARRRTLGGCFSSRGAAVRECRKTRRGRPDVSTPIELPGAGSRIAVQVERAARIGCGGKRDAFRFVVRFVRLIRLVTGLASIDPTRLVLDRDRGRGRSERLADVERELAPVDRVRFAERVEGPLELLGELKHGGVTREPRELPAMTATPSSRSKASGPNRAR